MCQYHRNSGKHIVDKWKMDNGCNNRDAHYGFPCTTKEILDPSTIDVNHIDGKNHNRHESNIETLCKMCHTMVTKLNGHHLSPRINRTMAPCASVLDELFSF